MEEEGTKRPQSEHFQEGTIEGTTRGIRSRQALELHHGSHTFPTLRRSSSPARSYDSIKVAGYATDIFGDIHGSVHYHIRPRLDVLPDASVISSESSPPSSPSGYKAGPYLRPGPSFPPLLLPLQNRQKFFGREALIEQIEPILFESQPPEHRLIALTGLGGIGKSRCAMEIAYRTKATRPECSVFWVQATNLETVQQGYRYIAETLRLQSKKTPGDYMELVRQYLSSDSIGQYLLILDDADDSSLWVRGLPGGGSSRPLLMDYIPRHPQGAILLTTRSRQVAVRIAGKQILPLDVLDTGSANLLLHSRLHIPVVDQSEAMEIVKWLTCCPLAVMRAADFVNETGTKLATLLRLFQKNEATIVELLGTDAEDVNDDGSARAIRQTWLLAVDRIRREDPHAFKILAYRCCLGHIDVPFRMLPAAPSLLTQARSLGLLTGYGLLQRTGDNDESSTFAIQWLVYIAARDWLARTGDFHNIIKSALTDTIVLLSDDASNSATEELSSYLPSLLRLYEAGRKAKIELRYDMLERAADLYDKQKLLEACKQCLEHLNSDSLSVFGQDHLKTFIYSGMLGQALYGLQDFGRARDQLQKAVSFRLGQLDSVYRVRWYTFAGHLYRTYKKLDDHGNAIELANDMFDRVHANVSTLGQKDAATVDSAKDVIYLWLDANLTNANGEFHASVQLDRLNKLISCSSIVFGESHAVTKQLKCGLAVLELNLPGYNDRNYLVKARNIITDVLGPDNAHSAKLATRLENLEIKAFRAVIDPILKDVSINDWSAAATKMKLMDGQLLTCTSHEETAILKALSLFDIIEREPLTNFTRLFTEALPHIPSHQASQLIHALEEVIIERYKPSSYPGYGEGKFARFRWSKTNQFARYYWSRTDDIPLSILAATTILSCMWQEKRIRCCVHELKNGTTCNFNKDIQNFVSTIVYELCRHKKVAEAALFLEACVQCYGSCPMWFVTRCGESDKKSHTMITARLLSTMRILELLRRSGGNNPYSSPVYANDKRQMAGMGVFTVAAGMTISVGYVVVGIGMGIGFAIVGIAQCVFEVAQEFDNHDGRSSSTTS